MSDPAGSDTLYLLCAAGCLLIAGYKAWAWRTAPHDRRPTIIPICVSMSFAGVSFAFAAPIVSGWFDRLTGVPSLAVLAVYSTSVAFICSGQVMLLYWRYPAARAWRVTRAIMPVYGAVLLAMIVLFLIGPVRGEHVLDFPAMNSTVPSLATMLVLYFLAYVGGLVNVIRLCLRWSYDDATAGRPWLRAGLRLSALGLAFPCTYGVLELGSVFAIAGGAHLDQLPTVIAPGICSLGVPVLLVANSIAAWGPRLPTLRANLARRLADLRDYRTLRALWEPLSAIDPAMIHRPLSLADRLRPGPRLLLRVIEINDWLHRLRDHRDPVITRLATAAATTAGLGPDETAALVEAARIRAALENRSSPANAAGPAEASEVDAPEQAGHAFASEQERLVLVARAFTSPLLSEVLRSAPEAAAALRG
jgi:hypothetical protein